jgi:hypothetical protein
MEITPHLSEAELAEFIFDPAKGLGTHLEFCDSCLNEVARLRETVGSLRTSANKPEEFWNQQRAAIRNQIATASMRTTHGFRWFVWVPAFAVMILAGLLVTGGTPAPAPIQANVTEDPDHQLLIAVEQVMQSSGPDALEPATYFVQQIKQEARTNSRSTIRNQEISNAN